MEREGRDSNREDIPGSDEVFMAIFRPTPGFKGRTSVLSVFDREARISTSAAPRAGMMGETIRLPLNVYMYTEYCLSNWPFDNHRMRSAQQAILKLKHS